MNPLTRFLEHQACIILDGGLATELECRGADLRDPLWSARLLLENPALIRQVHYDYFQAGADIATSASYQATLPGLMQRGLTVTQAEDVLRSSVRLAIEARDQFWQDTGNGSTRLKPLIAASIGCYGASRHDGSEYRGDYGMSVSALRDWHLPRMQILANAGADLLACETVPCLAEAEALVELLRQFPEVPAWLSVSCQDGQRLCHGEPFADVVALANDSPNIMAVGVNCTAPRFISDLLQSVRGDVKKPLLAYPNSGETWNANDGSWQTTPDDVDWAALALSWYEAGARLIGGCCRTTPAIVRQITNALRHKK